MSNNLVQLLPQDGGSLLSKQEEKSLPPASASIIVVKMYNNQFINDWTLLPGFGVCIWYWEQERAEALLHKDKVCMCLYLTLVFLF